MALQFIGIDTPTIQFPATNQSTVIGHTALETPPGTTTITICLQAFSLGYAGHAEFGFGQFQIDLMTGGGLANATAYCTVTVTDDTINQRQWSGSVRALITYYGNAV